MVMASAGPTKVHTCLPWGIAGHRPKRFAAGRLDTDPVTAQFGVGVSIASGARLERGDAFVEHGSGHEFLSSG
jgi:hypothetical protein